MKKSEFDNLFKLIIHEVKKTRDSGQKEYAHTEDNVFANFERVATSLDISKEQALMVYLSKHIDGINAWVKGYKSQREDVRGRIKDAIVYLCLLWGMAETISDNESINNKQNGTYSMKFNPNTGEVSYQNTGDEAI